MSDAPKCHNNIPLDAVCISANCDQWNHEPYQRGQSPSLSLEVHPLFSPSEHLKGITVTEHLKEFMKSPPFKLFEERTDQYWYEVLDKAIDGLNIREQEEFWKWHLGKLEGPAKQEKAQNAILWAIGQGLG